MAVNGGEKTKRFLVCPALAFMTYANNRIIAGGGDGLFSASSKAVPLCVESRPECGVVTFVAFRNTKSVRYGTNRFSDGKGWRCKGVSLDRGKHDWAVVQDCSDGLDAGEYAKRGMDRVDFSGPRQPIVIYTNGVSETGTMTSLYIPFPRSPFISQTSHRSLSLLVIGFPTTMGDEVIYGRARMPRAPREALHEGALEDRSGISGSEASGVIGCDESLPPGHDCDPLNSKPDQSRPSSSCIAMERRS
jgi:hypothetical protein